MILRRAQIMIVQHLDHLAGRDPAASAFRRHPRQFGAQRLELRDLLRDVGQMTLGDRIGLAAGSVRMVGQIEQGADGVWVKPQLTRMTD